MKSSESFSKQPTQLIIAAHNSRTEQLSIPLINYLDPNKDGNSLEITCDLCQENLPSPTHYRRHNIDKHKKYNHSLMKYKESYCCDECGKTFKVILILISIFTYFKIWTEHSLYFLFLFIKMTWCEVEVPPS